jgi:hypothetical protein
MFEIGLINPGWQARDPSELAARLQKLIDTPEGRSAAASVTKAAWP